MNSKRRIGDSMVTHKFKLRQEKGGSSQLRARVAGSTVLFTFLFIAGALHAQDFQNTGSINNTGTLRVKHRATGLPDTVNGRFEYFGGNQQVEAKNYENLLLTGNGTKNATATDVNILRTIAVADGVKFQVASTMTLEKVTGRISDESGLIIGKVRKTTDLNASSDSSDFGGIGLSIRSGGSALGTTEIVRTSGTSPNGTSSIKRWYEVNPTNGSGLSGNLYFGYAKDELAGQDSAQLEVWRSPDNGITWRRQHSVRQGNTLMRTGKFLKGYWTAADTNNLIGRTNYEFDPDSLSPAGPDSLKKKIKSLLNPFIAQITDVYGNPIPGARVHFGITQVPLGAIGHFLSDTLVTADSLGRISTQLKLGDRRGSYKVVARVESARSTQMVFTGYADPGATNILAVDSPLSDSIKTTLNPFIVEARDADSLAAADVSMRFAIVKAPFGATQQALVQADTITGTNGRASARLRLGEKVGEYVVVAYSPEVEGVVDTFRVVASHGIPALAWQRNLF
jgi:hypothetical protein